MTALLRPLSSGVTVAALCVGVGAVLAANDQVGFALAIAGVAVFALAAPAGSWVLAAVVAALTFRGLVTLGVLPSVATFVDIPIAWGALAVALAKRAPRSPGASRQLRWLALLAAAVLFAWIFHRSEILRPLLYLALLGEPFAILGALLLDPPSHRLRRVLALTLAGLVAVQLPVVAYQVNRYGVDSDHVQGTLSGAGAGAHTLSAVLAVAALWLVATGVSPLAWRRLALAAVLLIVPFLADAKQVILSLPVALICAPWRRGLTRLALRTGLVAGAVAALFAFYPTAHNSLYFAQQARSGGGGKTETARIVWSHLRSDPESLVFGKGPAETVSRAAFMTTDLLQRQDSPLRVLDLHSAEIAVDAQKAATIASGGDTSVNSGVSSALGVLGDLGLFGVVAYLGLFLSVYLALRRTPGPAAVAAAGGWAMFGVLGLVFDWWEQPPFSVFLAVLTGLALTTSPRRRRHA